MAGVAKFYYRSRLGPPSCSDSFRVATQSGYGKMVAVFGLEQYRAPRRSNQA